jgi:hypothetical protein
MRCLLLAVGLLLALPATAFADEDVSGPQFACVPRALRVMAAEVSGLRLQCEVTGAPSGDQDFTIELDQQASDVAEVGSPALGQRTVCSGSLSDGGGACLGAVLNRASPAFGEMRLSATFLPSGTRLEAVGWPESLEPLPEP